MVRELNIITISKQKGRWMFMKPKMVENHIWGRKGRENIRVMRLLANIRAKVAW